MVWISVDPDMGLRLVFAGYRNLKVECLGINRMGINILYNLLWLFAATTFESRGTKVRQHHVHVPKNNIATLYSWSRKLKKQATD